jgi:hypothetical protein
VFCVGDKPSHWRFADSRVEVRVVEPLYGDYFLGNKSYGIDVDCDRLLFLDADTLVLAPLDRLWAGWRCDFRARPANANWAARWNHDVWTQNFRAIGASVLPMFNTGVLLFQNGSHRRVVEPWRARIHDYFAGRLEEALALDRCGLSEQCGLSLAVSQARLETAIMGPSDHSFGWIGEPYAGAVVLHTSAQPGKFQRFCTELGVTTAGLISG